MEHHVKNIICSKDKMKDNVPPTGGLMRLLVQIKRQQRN